MKKILILILCLCLMSSKDPIKDTVSTANGIASYYGGRFHGRKTASGEKFDQYKLTAASNIFPLGTIVRVTNKKNGKSVVVKINDRMGNKSRIIDLSKAAAKEINIIEQGLAQVKVEVI